MDSTIGPGLIAAGGVVVGSLMGTWSSWLSGRAHLRQLHDQQKFERKSAPLNVEHAAQTRNLEAYREKRLEAHERALLVLNSEYDYVVAAETYWYDHQSNQLSQEAADA